jgi:hypothetical protein
MARQTERNPGESTPPQDTHPDGTPQWQPHMGSCHEDVYGFNDDEAARSRAHHPLAPVPLDLQMQEELDRFGF